MTEELVPYAPFCMDYYTDAYYFAVWQTYKLVCADGWDFSNSPQYYWDAVW